MRRRTADFHRYMFIRAITVADDGVEVIDADHVHVLIVFKEISFNANQSSQSLFIKKMPGKQHVVFFTPLMDLLIESAAVKIGQRVVKVITDARAIGTDIEEQVWQARA